MARSGFQGWASMSSGMEIVDYAAPAGCSRGAGGSIRARHLPHRRVYVAGADPGRFTVIPNYAFADAPAMDAFLIPGGLAPGRRCTTPTCNRYIRQAAAGMPDHQRVPVPGIYARMASLTGCRPPTARSRTGWRPPTWARDAIDRLAGWRWPG